MVRWILAVAFCITNLPFASANSTVHLRRLNGDLMVVPMLVNGKGPFDFVIDTGTNATLVDPDLVQQTELRAVGTKLLTALTGKTVVQRYVLDRLQVGNESYTQVEVLAQPMPGLHNLDSRIHGILGFDMLRLKPFRLDYAHNRMDFFAAEESPVIVGGTRVPVEVRDDRILVRLLADDAPPQGWRLALDTGTPQVIIFRDRIGPSLLARAGGGRSQDISTAQVITNLSQRAVPILTFRTAVIGGLLFKNVPVVILPSEMSAQSSLEDGLLPSSIFPAVLFDLANSNLVLNPELADRQASVKGWSADRHKRP
jgi:hypothetical protein